MDQLQTCSNKTILWKANVQFQHFISHTTMTAKQQVCFVTESTMFAKELKNRFNNISDSHCTILFMAYLYNCPTAYNQKKKNSFDENNKKPRGIQKKRKCYFGLAVNTSLVQNEICRVILGTLQVAICPLM